ncbi:MAG TPA: GNAT family N-acetyltransferase [Gemmatimonadaceae bacterium]|nr:GNAT family N-acetyltransferase [Gemmatimonadaceae bacterium]
MNLEITREAADGARLSLYGSIPSPYDARPGNHPASWLAQYDTDSWTILAALEHDRRVGSAIIVTAVQTVQQLGGRAGYALIWDLRVAPKSKRCGVGRALVRAAEEVALDAGCLGLDVETQDVNTDACQFYAAVGFQLRTATRNAYADAPREARLMWTRALE